MKPLIALAFSAALLSACATAPTLYGPRTTPQSTGFSEYRLEAGRYRVSFRGGPGAPIEQISDYALLRAAELTVRDGYDWFRISDRVTESTGQASGPRLSVGGGSSSYGRRSSVGLGVGTSFNLGGGPAIIRTIEVVFGKGARPKDADAYDAREIIQSIGRGHQSI
ncbi:MAG: hypothetical protein JWP92_952 [Caulobacter sp.]|nr:hypothetical protein [Caulobacter sp.]